MKNAAIDSTGQIFSGFEVTQSTPIPELGSTLTELVHLQTGARVLHLANVDPENLFCLSFQTLPSSSNGAPHILEHTVLCGSKKYPVKDPFFAMTRRSLHTFMNALTGSDFTCYPASSQLEKDFYHLLDVYLDAVFHPKLRHLSFLQEGHRLERVDGKLQFQGVVFNEMKGAHSAPESRLWHSILRHLTPDLPYAFESGGTPEEIPNLTWDELKAFHQEFYHPSRCLFYFYGNIPLEKHLHFIESRILKHSHKLAPLSPIPRQKRFHSPIHAESHYPIGENESADGKTYITFSWLTVPLSHQMEILALSLLESIWFETDASYLKKILLQSGLCQEVESSMVDEMSEVPFVITCKGCELSAKEALEKLIFEALEKFAAKPINPQKIETALYQLEMERSEITGDDWPFGLMLYFRAGLLRQQGCDPLHGLMIHTLFKQLREAIQDPTFLPSLVQTHFLQNTHRLTLTLSPDPHLAKKELEHEAQTLEKIEAHLTEEDRKRIVHQSEELLKFQEETERQSLDCLPKVLPQDLPPEPQDFLLKQTDHVFHHEVFTNQFTYADLIFELPALTKEELPYVSLLASLWTDLGYGKKTYEESQAEIEEISGGIGGSLSLYSGSGKVQPAFILHGKSLDRKKEDLLRLLQHFATSPRFDEKKRILEWLGQHASDLETHRVKRALSYASHLATSGTSISSYIQNECYGLPYFSFIETLKKDKKGHWIERLASLAKRLTSSKPTLVLACNKESFEGLEKTDFADLLKGWNHSSSVWTPDFPHSLTEPQIHFVPAPVAFTALAMQTAEYLAPLSLATEIFGNTILHKEIREKGGAYGSGATYSPSNGSFYFYSYRDPHLHQTLEIFEKAVQKLSQGDFTEDELEEAKIGLIGTYDKPVSPGRRAMTAYGWLRTERTLEKRRAFRKQILHATREAIAETVQKYLTSPKKTFASLLGEKLWEKEKRKFPHPPKTV